MSDLTIVSSYNCQILQLSYLTTVKSHKYQILPLSDFTTVRCCNCQILQLSGLTTVRSYDSDHTTVKTNTKNYWQWILPSKKHDISRYL